MTMNNVAYLVLFSALGMGCDVKQDLGETASGTGTGGESSSGTTGGSGDTGVLDTGPWSGTVSAGSSDSGDSGVLDTGPWNDTGEETDSSSSGDTGEPLDQCQASETYVRWDYNSLSPIDLGVNTTFVGVGDCSVTVDDPPGDAATVQLACTLSGSRDGTDFADESIDIDLELETNGPLPNFWPSVAARFLVGGTGFKQAGDRFVVLSQPMFPNDADGPILIATHSTSIEPLGFQLEGWWDTPWYGGPSFTSVDAMCETGDAPECAFDVAIEGGWLDEAPVAVHGTESAAFGAPTEGGSYDLFVETAWEASENVVCPPDFPGAAYHFVAFGATP